MASLILTVGVALAQRTVRGVVISADDNQPVIGASVRVKGTTLGMSTDLEGRFLFKNVPTNAKTLVVSFVGFKTQEVPIKPEMRIILLGDTSELVELVISGYGSAKSIANTTASIVKVSSKTIQDKPVPNVFDALQGKVAGLQVFTGSGEPSQLSSVQLHGTGTLSSLSSAPLYILDGIPVSAGTVMGMNQNDFENVQVLKDASATSIYGARAANGVIYITTKKGAVGERASIIVRGKYGASSLANTDYFESMMNAEELRQLYFSMGLKGFATEEDLAKHRKAFPHDFKWYKYFYRDSAPTYDADVAISGGGGRTNYYISGGLHSSAGLRPRSSYDRFNMRVNLNSSLNDYISFGLKTSVTYDISRSTFGNRNSLYGGLGHTTLPYYTPYDKDGNPYYGEVIPNVGIADINYVADMLPSRSTSLNVSSVANVVLKPIKNLTLSATAGMDLSDDLADASRKPSHFQAKGNGSRSLSFGRSANWTFSNTAEYKFSLADKHNFTLLAAHEYIESNNQGFSASGIGIVDDRILMLSAVTKEKNLNESKSEYAFLSFFGRFSYDYLNRYFLDVTLRNDASSRFHPDVRNGQFWSVGLMWKMKQENFLKDASWLDDATLKLSHGTSGNAGVGPYDYIATSVASTQYGGVTGWGIGNSGNQKLTWENQAKTTLGISLRMLDFLGVNLELYNRVTTDMLMDVPVPYTTGVSTVMSNVGSYQNRGIDLRLDANILKSKDGLNMAAYFNFNYNKDKVLSLFQGRDRWEVANTGVAYVVGKPLMFYYPIFKQVNPETGYPEWYLPGDNVDITTKDPDKVTSNMSPNLNQNTGVARYAPVTGGWGFNLDYKGLYLNADFTFALGKHLINNDRFFSENALLFANDGNVSRSAANFWKKKGDIVQLPSVEAIVKLGRNRFMEFDTRMLEDASFMRLKNLTIGYQMPKSVLAKQNFFKSVKVYVTGRNLLTFTKFSGSDPEPNSNLVIGGNPNTKQMSVGLELGL